MSRTNVETRRSLIEDFLAGRIVDEEEAGRCAALLRLPAWPRLVMILRVDAGDDGLFHSLNAVRDELAGMVGAVAGNRLGVLVAARGAEQLVVLVASDGPGDDVSRLGATLAEEIRRLAFARLGVTITVAVGGSAATPGQVGKSFAQARRALARGPFLGGDRVIYELEAAELARKRPYSLTTERQLCACIRAGDADSALRLVPQLLPGVVGSGHPGEIRVRCAELATVLSRAALESGADAGAISNRSCAVSHRLEGVGTVADLLSWLRAAAAEFAQEVAGRRPRERRLIDEAVCFIHGNYADDLTLQRVANAVSVSPYYLSHLFRRQCGCTFLECLTRARVDAAKQLLIDTTTGIGEIGSQVGYEDANYFAQVFKRAEGITPSEYRRNLTPMALPSHGDRRATREAVAVGAREGVPVERGVAGRR